MQATNDAQIRNLLIPFVRAEHVGDPDTIYLEEFALYGGTNRADYAALNRFSHGYEIKSDRDTLARLPQQVEAYCAVFERATLVSASRHLSPAQQIIPEWWGIIEVQSGHTCGLHLGRIRESRPNPKPSAEAIASLLWRPEALRILERLGLDNGVRSKPMDHLIARLALTVTPEKLSQYVRETLRARGDWRAAARLKRCDGTSRRLSSRSDFPHISSESIVQ
jgi:hypothetical protein